MKKVKFDIQGMTCSSCSAHIDKTIKRTDNIMMSIANINKSLPMYSSLKSLNVS